MESASVLRPLLGGMLIGLASIVILKAHGRVAGVSGIVGSLLRPASGDVGWRAAFGAGLLLAGVLAAWLAPDALAIEGVPGVWGVIASGLLVGFGTRLGNGCTSGHGVCGVSRLSRRSIAATMTFMLTGGITVYVMRHLLDGGG